MRPLAFLLSFLPAAAFGQAAPPMPETTTPRAETSFALAAPRPVLALGAVRRLVARR